MASRYPCQTYCFNELFCSQKLSAKNLLLIQCLNHLCSFCSVKMMLFSSVSNIYALVCFVSGPQFFHVERCSMITLTSLFYTLSWSQHQNVATLVQLGCKRNAWSSSCHMFIVMILCFFNNIMQDMR